MNYYKKLKLSQQGWHQTAPGTRTHLPYIDKYKDDPRLSSLIKYLTTLGVPETMEWTHSRTAPAILDAFDGEGEKAAEDFILDVLSSTETGPGKRWNEMNYGEPGTEEHDIARKIVDPLLRIQQQGR